MEARANKKQVGARSRCTWCTWVGPSETIHSVRCGNFTRKKFLFPTRRGSTLIQGWSLTKSDEDRSLGASSGARRRPSLILSSSRGCLLSWGRWKKLRLEAGVIFGILFYFSVSQEYVWHSFGGWGLRIRGVFNLFKWDSLCKCVRRVQGYKIFNQAPIRTKNPLLKGNSEKWHSQLEKSYRVLKKIMEVRYNWAFKFKQL